MRSSVITGNKRGRPVTQLESVKKKRWKSPKGAWIGKVKIVGNIVEFDATSLWDAFRKK
jgi:hypothetical protein